MGKTFENLTDEELCDLMCGRPEDEVDENGFSGSSCTETDNRSAREDIEQAYKADGKP